MPEMPEVQGLADFLRGRLLPDGAPPAVVAGVEVASFAVLKTADIPVESLSGAPLVSVERHGKFLALGIGQHYMVLHLARAGWLRWSDELPPGRLRPGKGAAALRMRFTAAGSPAGAPTGSSADMGFELTEAGTRKSMAVYLVERLQDVPGIARLGPDALALDRGAFAELVRGHRGQIKGLLRDQAVIAGIGNAYSDEILHAARLSPFAIAFSLDEEEVSRLYGYMQNVLRMAIAAASGRPASALKDAKRNALQVHGRTGQRCPVCGDVIREVSFADSSLQYCPSCQTGGKLLADRRTSKFLK